MYLNFSSAKFLFPLVFLRDATDPQDMLTRPALAGGYMTFNSLSDYYRHDLVRLFTTIIVTGLIEHKQTATLVSLQNRSAPAPRPSLQWPRILPERQSEEQIRKRHYNVITEHENPNVISCTHMPSSPHANSTHTHLLKRSEPGVRFQILNVHHAGFPDVAINWNQASG